MFFAEVLSGASQTWFVDGWGLLVTFPLYLAHLLFFLWIAFKLKKTSLSQLYLFGILFSLYESWITKVLWAGYLDAPGPGLGTFLGIGIIEFPILTFFWHPIMSFIVPILVFEILTGNIIEEHEKILRKTTKKTIIIVLFLVLISVSVANGNKFSYISSNTALIGSLLIVSGLYFLSKNASLKVFKFRKIGFIIISIYLALLYITTFNSIFPERIPNTITPYISISFFYVIAILLIAKSDTKDAVFRTLDNNHYTARDFLKFSAIIIIAVNIACISSDISMLILVIHYYALTIIGTVLFFLTIFRILKNIKYRNL